MTDLEYIRDIQELVDQYIKHTTDMITDFHDALMCFQTDFVQTSNKFNRDVLSRKIQYHTDN